MTSCSTPLFSAALPMKIVPYVHKAFKPKPKSKSKAKPAPGAKPLATTKMAEHSRSGADSEAGGEWFRIEDELTMLGWNASLPSSYEATSASHSIGPADVVSGLGGALELEKLEHHQPGRQSLVGRGTDHGTGVAKRNSALTGPFDGSSLDFPSILESDAAEEHHTTTNVKPSNGASEYQGSGYHTAADAEQDRVGQYGDLNATSMHALSEEGIVDIRREPLPAEDQQLLFDVTSRSPSTRKRTHCLSDTTISSAEVPEITSEPELEDSHLAKRRRLSNRQAESLIHDHVPTPNPTPLQTRNSPDCRSGVSSEPSPGPFDNGSQGGRVGSPILSQGDLEEENGIDGTHGREIVEELLHSPRQSSSCEEVEGDQYIDLDSDRRAEKRYAMDGEIEKSHEDELSQTDDVSCKASVTISQRRKPSNRPVSKKGRNPSKISLRPRDQNSVPITTSPQVSPSQSRHLSTSRTERVTCSPHPQNPYPATKAGDDATINDGPSESTAYHIADIGLYPAPQGSSLVTAIVRYSGSGLPSSLMASYHSILGERGQFMRMIQLSLDSWLLLGYRYGGVACARGSSTLRHADWMSSFRSDAASHDGDYPEDDGEEDDENGEKGKAGYRPHATGSDPEFSRSDMPFRQRTHKPWKESDEQRLLSYKDKMAMDWDQVVSYFPDQSPGAVKLRYYMLRKKDS